MGRRKRIIIAIILILTLPIHMFIETNGWYANKSVYMFFSIITTLCFFAGFCIIGITLVGSPSDPNVVTQIGGKRIKNEAFQNLKDMTLLEKIENFNIVGLILRIFAIPAFFGLFTLLLDDPLNVFEMFENVASIKIYVIVIIATILNILFILFRDKYHSKITTSTITTFIVECLLTGYFVYYLMYLAQ